MSLSFVARYLINKPPVKMDLSAHLGVEGKTVCSATEGCAVLV